MSIPDPPSSRPKAKLFDAINVPLLAIVAICFFLPLLELDCAGKKARFSGPSLALGTDPSVVGGTAQDGEGLGNQLRREKIRTDPLLILFPLSAMVGAFLAGVAYKRPGAVKTTLLAVFPTIAAIVLISYAVVGFGLERKIAEERSRKDPNDRGSPVTVEKTNWFDFALLGSCLSVALAAGRKYSPPIGLAEPAPLGSMAKPDDVPTP